MEQYLSLSRDEREFLFGLASRIYKEHCNDSKDSLNSIDKYSLHAEIEENFKNTKNISTYFGCAHGAEEGTIYVTIALDFKHLYYNKRISTIVFTKDGQNITISRM